ncbi:MAG: RIP metalloprotease RseP [Hyphomicrobiaceae bacterium]
MSAIANFLYVPAVFLAVLTIVVFIHELGHFLVARWCGVKIEAFSIGFGKEIFGWTDRYNTRWRLAWVPLGGYVKFIDDANAASAPSRESLEGMTSDQRAGAFQTKPLRHRAAIVAAGPAFNIISAFLIYVMTFWAFGTFGTAAVVDEVLPGSAAQRAGIQSGDTITKIEDTDITRFSDLQRIVGQSPGTPLAFTVDRGGRSYVLTVTPELREIVDPIGNKLKVGAIGVKRNTSPTNWRQETHSLPQSVVLAVRETTYVSSQILTAIPKLPGAIVKVFSGQRQNEIGGPIAIAEMTAHASKSGAASLLGWMAVFSIMLGIMNLLPIPMLDGGHLLFYAIEGLRGKPLDERKQELSFKIGMALLATMMVAALLGDFMRKLGLG